MPDVRPGVPSVLGLVCWDCWFFGVLAGAVHQQSQQKNQQMYEILET